MKTTAFDRRDDPMPLEQQNDQSRLGHDAGATQSTWELYELKKRGLQARGLSQHEYELAVRLLADELGV
ncbi:hypothetical protein [Aeromonas veronii]|uniref:hypothetical protein n=1 Tax=Aeromonas TaxID=642 RepID=UPI003B9EABE8